MVGVSPFSNRYLYSFLHFVAKSPVFTHISASLTGLSTIRAFQAENILRDEFEGHQDLNSGTWYMFIGNFVTTFRLCSKS